MGKALRELVQWLDRFGVWPLVGGGALILAGYLTGVLGLVWQFTLPVQLAILLGLASLFLLAGRSLLRKLAPPAPELVVTGMAAPMFWDSGEQADGAWVQVDNIADKPQGDAVDVFGIVTFLDPDTSRVVIPAFPGRWRDSPYPSKDHGVGEITDRKGIGAARFRQLDVAFKLDGDHIAHPLNTDAMQYPSWRKPGWDLPPGAYIVKVRVSGVNVSPFDSWFGLRNPGDGPLTIEELRRA